MHIARGEIIGGVACLCEVSLIQTAFGFVRAVDIIFMKGFPVYESEQNYGLPGVGKFLKKLVLYDICCALRYSIVQ